MEERKTTFERQNFTILVEKIPSIRSEMTGENAEFQSKFNEIRLKIQIRVKMEEKKERHLKDKISQF